jgi:hypothetical protein
MALIPEAIEHLTGQEKELHEKLKDIKDTDIYEYLLKRMQFSEITKEEIDHLNKIYESGTTEFSFMIYGKPHTMRLLKQKEKTEINRVIDNLFNRPSDKKDDNEKYKYYNEDEKSLAMQAFRILAIVSMATVSLENDRIDLILKEKGAPDVLLNRVGLFEEMNNTIIQMLFNKYNEFENRIYTLFDFESVRKK